MYTCKDNLIPMLYSGERKKKTPRQKHGQKTSSSIRGLVMMHQAQGRAFTHFHSDVKIVTYRELKSTCQHVLFFQKSPLCGEYEYLSKIIYCKGKSVSSPSISQGVHIFPLLCALSRVPVCSCGRVIF